MKKQVLLLAILFLTTSIFSQCNIHRPIISSDGNYIYFSSDKNGGNYQIYRASASDFTNSMQLTNISGVNNYYPSVSPDGSLIVFQSGNMSANSEIYIMNNDGSNLQQLTSNSVHDGRPNFSPDGTKIVFEAWDTSQYPEIFTMNIDGTVRTQLTNVGGADWQSAPIYNTDGSKIYFSKSFNADGHYVMMDLDGSNWVDITEPNSFGYSEGGLHFNATGDKIVFYTTEWVGYNNGSDVVIADADGSNWVKLSNSTAAEYYYLPCFHPTNSKIYYNYYWASGTAEYSIYTMDLDGDNKFEFSNCEGLDLNEYLVKEKFIIYPNPSKDEMIISINSDFSIELYDLSGSLVLFSCQKQTSISNLPTGLYMAVIKDKNNKVLGYQKIVKE